VPWNYPQTLAAFKYGAALAAGCTVVMKPSPETVLDSFLLAEAIEAAGIPGGVINIVPGGRELGAYLVEHRDVDKVAFTGSTAAGRRVRIANDTDYGLGGSVWTADPERGKAVARRVRTGTIGVNKYLPDPAAPFGGVKASGIGRELGPEAIGAYQQFKSIYT
jgi:acyl-CoA reductase-like NAD-dependent aldehyde dehydrogenase